MGFEPMMRVLQTLALPLGDVAVRLIKTWLAVMARNEPFHASRLPLCRAGDGIRTHDLLLGKETYYHCTTPAFPADLPSRVQVPRDRIELTTPRFSVACSTN